MTLPGQSSPIDDDIIGDLDSFSAFSDGIRGVRLPHTFKPVGIDKFDGDSDPKTWLRTYSVVVCAANGNNDVSAAYGLVMMSHQALNWLEGLGPSSIDSWQDLCTAFIN